MTKVFKSQIFDEFIGENSKYSCLEVSSNGSFNAVKVLLDILLHLWLTYIAKERILYYAWIVQIMHIQKTLQHRCFALSLQNHINTFWSLVYEISSYVNQINFHKTGFTPTQYGRFLVLSCEVEFMSLRQYVTCQREQAVNAFIGIIEAA